MCFEYIFPKVLKSKMKFWAIQLTLNRYQNDETQRENFLTPDHPKSIVGNTLSKTEQEITTLLLACLPTMRVNFVGHPWKIARLKSLLSLNLFLRILKSMQPFLPGLIKCSMGTSRILPKRSWKPQLQNLRIPKRPIYQSVINWGPEPH